MINAHDQVDEPSAAQSTVGNSSRVTDAPCDGSAQAIAAVERLNGRDRSTVAFDAGRRNRRISISSRGVTRLPMQ
ncbi:hypothetical protein OR985_17660 [Burkholderia ambifaria]|nr:hypothetical protein [Burkholderia ambifaria]WDS02591.1 hypothetical protein OR985_17660 [Burkholderia ambifaria]